MVHPRLTQDPSSMRGVVGTISAADLAGDTILVAFGDKGAGRYQSDALLALKSHQELYQDLLENVKQLEVGDFKNLLRLSMYQDSGSPRLVREAFQALSSSEAALEFATRPLSQVLEMNYGQDLQQGKSLGMGR